MSDLTDRIYSYIPKMEGWCTPEKAVALSNCILENKPNTIVEIGVFGGRSLMAMAFTCQFLNNGKVYGIDPWTADAALRDVQEKENLDWWSKVDYEYMYKKCLVQIIEHDASSVCNLYRTTSDKAVFMFDKVNMVHIDGNHSESQSTQDVFMWMPKVPPGGYIWFDDIDWYSTKNAVRLLEERCERFPDIGNCGIFKKK